MLIDVSGCSFLTLETVEPRLQADTMFLVFSSEHLSGIRVDLLEVNENPEKLYENPTKRFNQFLYRPWVFTLLASCCLLVFIKSTDARRFQEMITFSFVRKASTADFDDSGFSLSSVFMIILISILMLVNYSNTSLAANAGGVFTILTGIIFILLAKRVIIFSFSRLFKSQKIAVIQFEFYLHFLCATLLLIFAFQTVFVWKLNPGFLAWSGFKYSALILSALYVIWFFFYSLNKVTTTKLHLIAYLCATEIFPTFLLANWLFK